MDINEPLREALDRIAKIGPAVEINVSTETLLGSVRAAQQIVADAINEHWRRIEANRGRAISPIIQDIERVMVRVMETSGMTYREAAEELRHLAEKDPKFGASGFGERLLAAYLAKHPEVTDA